ncbi:MAG: C69 family dipeptidase [Bacteroidales bacterium]|nr:C69 family dipeptidase [Candidatus Cacconaster merdequi]
MRRTLIFTLCCTVFLALNMGRTDACTNVIITKGASADGSCMISYAADSHTEYGELYFHPAKDWPAGSMLEIFDWETGISRGFIPQVAHTYQTTGNMNEHQLIIGETTFGGRPGLENKDGIIDYGSLIYVTLQRARTAREAISTIDNLMQTYGYPSEGESFSIADKDECWIMEIVGKGEEKGAVWVAVRIPDGYICSHANQSRIHHFPLNDPENCLYSKDVISFARKMGFFEGKDEDFSFCDAYCPADWSGLRACEARVWSAFRILGGNNFDSEKYLDFAMGFNPANKMPLYILPEKKVSVGDVARVMRDHFEDTPMDFRYDVGAGPSHLPYRWRPMNWEVDGKQYMFERSIATQQTGFWFIAQARGFLPDEVGALIWFAVDDAATSPLNPVYANVTSVPECFREGNGSIIDYSPTSAFWTITKVTHFAYLFYDRVAPEIQKVIADYESENETLARQMDQKAVRMLAAGNRNQAIGMLTEFCSSRAETMCNTWRGLETYLLVKFADGNVKIQNEDGSFKRNEAGNAVYPDQPDFPQHWLKSIVREHGDVIEVNR